MYVSTVIHAYLTRHFARAINFCFQSRLFVRLFEEFLANTTLLFKSDFSVLRR